MYVHIFYKNIYNTKLQKRFLIWKISVKVQCNTDVTSRFLKRLPFLQKQLAEYPMRNTRNNMFLK